MPPSETSGEEELPAVSPAPPRYPPAAPAPPPPRYPPPGPGAPAAGPPAATAPKAAPRPPAEPALQHRAVAALVVALLSLAGFLGFGVDVDRGVLVVIYALLAGVTALWLAVTAMRRARRGGTARPRGSVTATVIAGVGVGLATALLVAFGLFGRELVSYGRCMSGASTIAAQQSCYDSFSHALDRKIGLLGTPGHG